MNTLPLFPLSSAAPPDPFPAASTKQSLRHAPTLAHQVLLVHRTQGSPRNAHSSYTLSCTTADHSSALHPTAIYVDTTGFIVSLHRVALH